MNGSFNYPDNKAADNKLSDSFPRQLGKNRLQNGPIRFEETVITIIIDDYHFMCWEDD